MSFFKAIKLLLPRSKAFDLTQETSLRKFFSGMADLPEDVRYNNELVYMDLWPDTSRAVQEWEQQFGILFSDVKYANLRSNILKALWRISIGGQSVQYLQDLLQNFDPGIRVYENNPVKNPRDANVVYASLCGSTISVCGNKKMCCGYKVGDQDFVPTVIRNNQDSTYDIPIDPNYWVNYFFVGGEVIRNSRNEIIYLKKILIDKKWQSFIEYVILKVKPVHMGAIVFIEYVENKDITRVKRGK